MSGYVFQPVLPEEKRFPKVKEAREALRARAVAIIQKYEAMIDLAIAAQDYETANKALQFLMEHMPAEEDGTKMIDQSVDKPKQVEGRSGPSITIGVALGGMPEAKQLPEAIEVKAERVE